MDSPEDEDDLCVPEVFEIKNEVDKLTATEKEILDEVLKRDDEIRHQEQTRLQVGVAVGGRNSGGTYVTLTTIRGLGSQTKTPYVIGMQTRTLKKELDELGEQGIQDGKEQFYGRVCARCCGPLGVVINRGSICPWCRKKICRNCRKPLSQSTWICTMCHKEREIKAESGAWFYDSLPKKKKVQYGSSLLKKFVRRRKGMKRNLSKSRRKSEDELVTSGELEYTIEKTFRPHGASATSQDKEYVLVDQKEDGDVIISEGKVAYNINNESEAAVAGLDIVQEERDESEATLLSKAANIEVEVGDVEHDVEGGNGMQEYFEQNQAKIESDSIAHVVGPANGAEAGFEAGAEAGFDVDVEAEFKADVEAELKADVEAGFEVDVKPASEGEAVEIEPAIKVSGSDSVESDSEAPNVENKDSEPSRLGFVLQVTAPPQDQRTRTLEKAQPELEHAGSEAETMATPEERPFEPAVVSRDIVSPSSDKCKIDADFKNPFEEDSNSEDEGFEHGREDRLIVGRDELKNDVVGDAEIARGISVEIKSDTEEIKVELERSRKSNGYDTIEEDRSLDIEPRKPLELDPTDLADEIVTEGVESDVGAVEDNLEAGHVVPDTSAAKRDEVEAAEFEKEAGEIDDVSFEEDYRASKKEQDVSFHNEEEVDIYLKSEEEDDLPLMNEEQGIPLDNEEQNCQEVIKSEDFVEDERRDTQIGIAIEKLELNDDGHDEDRKYKEEIDKQGDEYAENDAQSPTVKEVVAFYEEKETDNGAVSLKTNPEFPSFYSRGAEVEVQVISKKEVEHSSQSQEDIAVTVENNAKEVSYDHETGKVKGHKAETGSDVDAIFDEYIRKEKIEKRPMSAAESYESLDSNRSDDVYEAQRPQVKVAGEIFLGLKYEASSQHFEVQVHKAKGLVAVDTRKKTSDPYVKTYLLQDKSRLNKKKTKIKKHTLDPIFDEILTYKIAYEDLLSKTLSVSVWHNDMLGQNVFLGETQISVTDYIASGYSLENPVPQMYQLSEKLKTQSSSRPVGELSFEIMYIAPGGAPSQRQQKSPDPVSGQLVVKCIEAKDLEGTESTSPFCKLTILPTKSKSKDAKHKTSVESRTLNPYWDQEFLFDGLTFHDLSCKVLQISVHDAAAGNKKNFIGALRLGRGTSDQAFDDSNDKECLTWQRMLEEPNQIIPATIALRSSIESVKSFTALPPILVERIDEPKEEIPVRKPKSDSILSTGSASSFGDSSTAKASSLRPRFKQPDQHSLQSYGSMMSIYSDAGGYGSVPISGEMLFSIQYDNIAGVFEVYVGKAKNIAAANRKSHFSDPYVKTYLLPDKSKDSKKKTSFKKKTVNPEWNEKIKYKIGEKELMKRTLQVSIWNNEKFGHNDFLGEVQVQIAQYVNSGHSLDSHEPIWYTLQEMAPVSVSGPGYKGTLTIGLKYEAIDGDIGKLLVEVKEAKELRAADAKSLSNPFVKSYLLPDRTRKSKRKSTFKKGTLDPKWNEKFEYNGVSLEELEFRVLELTVWDHEPSSNDFLGGIRVGVGRGDQNWHDCSGKEVTVWKAMLEHPGIWVEFSVPLRDSMTSRKGIDIAPVEEDVVTPTVQSVPVVEPLAASEPLLRLGLMLVSPDAAVDKKKKKCQLKCNIKGARNLPVHSKGVSPSTYCKCFLQPPKIVWKFKTDLFKRSSEPLWEKEFVFSGIPLDDLQSKCLDIVVFEDNDVSIGMVRLGKGIMQASWDDSTGREIDLWNAMIENPDQWNNMMVPLRLNANISSADLVDAEESLADDVVEEQPEDVGDQKSEPKLSAKELALQSMGSEAASKVVSIIQSSGEAEKKTKTDFKSVSRQQDHDRNFRLLSMVREETGTEEDETAAAKPSRVRFTKPDQSTTDVVVKPSGVVPKVVVSADDDKSSKAPTFPPEEIEFEEDEIPHRVPKSNLSRVAKLGGGSRESLASMTSVYSGISPIYGSVPIKGEIQFALKYLSGTSTLEVHIFRAKDIAAADAKKNISDPYVKAYLLPDKTKASKRKTKVKHKTVNPSWDEILEYQMSLVDLRSRVLFVSIWNFDRFGRNIFLGEVVVPMDEQIEDNALDQGRAEWYELREKSQIQSPMLYKGELTVALKFDEQFASSDKKSGKDASKKGKKKSKDRQSRICIHVVKAVDLPSGDADGLCDPYCKFYLLPLKQAKTKRKTPVIKKTRTASWDFRAEYDADFDDLPELGIEFTVYDWDKHSRSDFLGCARLNLGGQMGKWDDAVGIEKEAWKTMIDQPNKWHEFVIPLRSSIDPRPKIEYD
eukprot:gene447-1088_t